MSLRARWRELSDPQRWLVWGCASLISVAVLLFGGYVALVLAVWNSEQRRIAGYCAGNIGSELEEQAQRSGVYPSDIHSFASSGDNYLRVAVGMGTVTSIMYNGHLVVVASSRNKHPRITEEELGAIAHEIVAENGGVFRLKTEDDYLACRIVRRTEEIPPAWRIEGAKGP